LIKHFNTKSEWRIDFKKIKSHLVSEAGSGDDNALEILFVCYARGTIGEEEYKKISVAEAI
jgi:uncharacterized membrane protein